jgi:Rap1a immunity proteins
MKVKLTVGFFAFLLMGSGQSAQIAHTVTPNTADDWKFKTGNDLLSDCEKPPGGVDFPFCVAYITGAVDMIGGLQGAVSTTDQHSFWKLRSVCLPTEATVQQIVDVVLKYMKENPEERADGASWIVTRAMVQAWGCPAK